MMMDVPLAALLTRGCPVRRTAPSLFPRGAGRPSLRYYDAHVPKHRWLTPADERAFVASVGQAAEASRFIAQRHVYFTAFFGRDALGGGLGRGGAPPPAVAYINVVREPVSRCVSRYNYEARDRRSALRANDRVVDGGSASSLCCCGRRAQTPRPDDDALLFERAVSSSRQVVRRRIEHASMDECAAPGGRCAFFGHNPVGGTDVVWRGSAGPGSARDGSEFPAVVHRRSDLDRRGRGRQRVAQDGSEQPAVVVKSARDARAICNAAMAGAARQLRSVASSGGAAAASDDDDGARRELQASRALPWWCFLPRLPRGWRRLCIAMARHDGGRAV